MPVDDAPVGTVLLTERLALRQFTAAAVGLLARR